MQNEYKTALYEQHLANNAKIVNFHNWLLPLYYSGINVEHINVRENMGMFDVSHMGKFMIKGKDAGNFLQEITTNDIEKLKLFKAQYNLLLNENGHILDDIIISKISEDTFYMVVNSACKEQDLNHIKSYAKKYSIAITDFSNDYSLIALQGKSSLTLLEELLKTDLSEVTYYGLTKLDSTFGEIVISRLGYTGEDGFEIMVHNTKAANLWDNLLTEGKKFKLAPAGLGARDTLRIEAAYLLYGQDMQTTTNPFSARLGFVTKMDKDNFLGKSALEKHSPPERKLVGLVALDKAVPRHGYSVCKKDQEIEIGKITSGCFSPILNQGIALAYLDISNCEVDSLVSIKIRNQLVPAKVIKLPFVKPKKPLLKRKK